MNARQTLLTDPVQWLPIRQVFRAFLNVLLRWQRRFEDRNYLSHMNEAMLRDIGMTRAEVDQESRKPFWRR